MVRLARSADIKRVRRLGKSYAHPLLVLVAAPNHQEVVRVGVIASRSVGGAVQRNRAKRVLRAVIHPWFGQVACGWDLLFLARQPMPEATFQQVQSAVETLFQRSGLVKV